MINQNWENILELSRSSAIKNFSIKIDAFNHSISKILLQYQIKENLVDNGEVSTRECDYDFGYAREIRSLSF